MPQLLGVPVLVRKNFDISCQPYLPQCSTSDKVPNLLNRPVSRDDRSSKEALRQGVRFVCSLGMAGVFHAMDNTKTKVPGPASDPARKIYATAFQGWQCRNIRSSGSRPQSWLSRCSRNRTVPQRPNEASLFFTPLREPGIIPIKSETHRIFILPFLLAAIAFCFLILTFNFLLQINGIVSHYMVFSSTKSGSLQHKCTTGNKLHGWETR